MQVVSLFLTASAALLTLFGLIPCLGCLNWLAVPLSVAAATVGVIGLATDRRPDGSADGQGIYLAGLFAGALLIGVGCLRCFLGGGVL